MDEVADLRAGTPSLAASAVVPDRRELAASLDDAVQAALAALSGRFDHAATRLAHVDRRGAVAAALERAGARLRQAGAGRELVAPGRELARAREQLRAVDWQAPAASRAARAATDLGSRWAEVEALSPARVLERGYAVVRRAADQSVVRRPDQAPAGDLLDLTVAGGALQAVVR